MKNIVKHLVWLTIVSVTWASVFAFPTVFAFTLSTIFVLCLGAILSGVKVHNYLYFRNFKPVFVNYINLDRAADVVCHNGNKKIPDWLGALIKTFFFYSAIMLAFVAISVNVAIKLFA